MYNFNGFQVFEGQLFKAFMCTWKWWMNETITMCCFFVIYFLLWMFWMDPVSLWRWGQLPWENTVYTLIECKCTTERTCMHSFSLLLSCTLTDIHVTETHHLGKVSKLSTACCYSSILLKLMLHILFLGTCMSVNATCSCSLSMVIDVFINKATFNLLLMTNSETYSAA